MVVQELFSGLDTDWLQWLIESFDNMHVMDMDGEWQRISGTLMSGHRMTSIINTILNAAYLRIVLGNDIYNACNFLHVGDDVLATCDEASVAHTVVNATMQSSLRFQRQKQGFGVFSAKFLRVCFNESFALGYLARAVASTVSGSWTSDIMLGEPEYCATLARNIWNLTNRSLVDTTCSLLLCTTVRRRLKLSWDISTAFCTSKVSVGGGPVRLDGNQNYRLTWLLTGRMSWISV